MNMIFIKKKKQTSTIELVIFINSFYLVKFINLVISLIFDLQYNFNNLICLYDLYVGYRCFKI